MLNSESIILETAKRTLNIEIETLMDMQTCIDEVFTACVLRIAESRGRLVVTGIGKSAIVGQKMVATFNSTGTPALFMHAADAIHGDLGMIQQEDVILCISKSGETAEIKVLLPLLANLGNVIIAMVSNRSSFLAQSADHVLYIPVSREADPNNLAPTASTTAQMVLGDALATALLALKGFSPKDFAQYHPGGSLGKQLYLRVRDLSRQNERPAVSPEADLPTVILEITSRRLGATAIVNTDKEVLGIITDGDLRRMLSQNRDFSHLRAGDIMSHHPRTIAADAMAIQALQLMRNHSITQLIVISEGVYEGMIHLHDLIREGLV